MRRPRPPNRQKSLKGAADFGILVCLADEHQSRHLQEVPAMPHLHMKGVEMVVDLLDAAEHVDKLSQGELKELLLEAANVLGELLKRHPRAG
jgi:hypothetical protein